MNRGTQVFKPRVDGVFPCLTHMALIPRLARGDVEDRVNTNGRKAIHRTNRLGQPGRSLHEGHFTVPPVWLFGSRDPDTEIVRREESCHR